MKRLTKASFRGMVALVALLAFAAAAAAQEMFSVNIWSTGRPGANGGIWGDEGSVDPADPDRDPDIDTLWLEPGDEEAGIWGTEEWDNYQQFPFTTSTAPMEITGSEGAVATIEVVHMRNPGTYMWDQVRDDADASSVPNATLLGSLVRGTEFDGPAGEGEPFPARIVDVEVTDLPFASYDVVVYLGTEQGRGPGGMIRVNDEIPDDPTELAGMPFNVLDGEPNGDLVEIVAPGDVGNYVLYEGLTDATLKIQAWGDGFNHVGIAGLQIMDAGPVEPEGVGPFLRGDCNGDGRVAGQVGDAIFTLNFNFLGGPVPSCMAACDSNGDGNVIGQVGDAIYTLNFNFLGGPPLPAPFPECGTSELAADEELGCDESACP